jgi:hypothetical protein
MKCCKQLIHSLFTFKIIWWKQHVLHCPRLQNGVWNEGYLPARGGCSPHPQEAGPPAEVVGGHPEGQLEPNEAFQDLFIGGEFVFDGCFKDFLKLMFEYRLS